MTKDDLRARFLHQRRAVADSQRQVWVAAIQKKLLALPQWQQARTVGVYLSLPEEVSTFGLIEQARREDKTIASPRLAPDRRSMDFYLWETMTDLTPGPHQILQPPAQRKVDPRSMDVMLVPGVAFDRLGMRLGYGKGYYDRYLSGCPAFKVGLAFDLQLADSLPATASDVAMDMVLTESCLLPGRRSDTR